MPLIVYDAAFQPMGTDPNTPPADRDTAHFQDLTATNSTLEPQGPKFPKQMTTIGNIISGCHDDINACVQHCRIAWSYKKVVKNLDGLKKIQFFTAGGHGRFRPAGRKAYLENLNRVAQCEMSCLTRKSCIHDISYLHSNANRTCDKMIRMCGKKDNCVGYNDFTCMSNCVGDLCYPEYRFLQDIEDFKVQVKSRIFKEQLSIAQNKHLNKHWLDELRKLGKGSKARSSNEEGQMKQFVNHLIKGYMHKHGLGKKNGGSGNPDESILKYRIQGKKSKKEEHWGGKLKSRKIGPKGDLKLDGLFGSKKKLKMAKKNPKTSKKDLNKMNKKYASLVLRNAKHERNDKIKLLNSIRNMKLGAAKSKLSHENHLSSDEVSENIASNLYTKKAKKINREQNAQITDTQRIFSQLKEYLKSESKGQKWLAQAVSNSDKHNIVGIEHAKLEDYNNMVPGIRMLAQKVHGRLTLSEIESRKEGKMEIQKMKDLGEMQGMLGLPKKLATVTKSLAQKARGGKRSKGKGLASPIGTSDAGITSAKLLKTKNSNLSSKNENLALAGDNTGLMNNAKINGQA